VAGSGTFDVTAARSTPGAISADAVRTAPGAICAASARHPGRDAARAASPVIGIAVVKRVAS
jgi:hypothetical protein